jgi:hypothetical protein
MSSDSSGPARTLKSAEKLGHRLATDEENKTLAAELNNLTGIFFARERWRENSVCFVGLCNPATQRQLVGYYDRNGNCNRFAERRCNPNN